MDTITDASKQPLKEKLHRIEQHSFEDNFMMSPGTQTDGEVEIDYSFSFAGTCYEPRYSKSYDQNVVINGKPTKKKITRATYTIPILSGILGILLPRKNYKLMPMSALKDLIIEL